MTDWKPELDKSKQKRLILSLDFDEDSDETRSYFKTMVS